MNAESQKVNALRAELDRWKGKAHGLERKIEAMEKHAAVLEKGAAPHKERVLVLAKEVEELKQALADDHETAMRNIGMREDAIRNLTALNRAMEKRVQDLETKGLPQDRVLVPTAGGILIPKSAQGPAEPSEHTKKIIELSGGLGRGF